MSTDEFSREAENRTARRNLVCKPSFSGQSILTCQHELGLSHSRSQVCVAVAEATGSVFPKADLMGTLGTSQFWSSLGESQLL